mmetsp:Transcript_40601/g.107596  ORF Transcript_40601/g.107596 Transcript_40601/m.107596 type:complete len:155 (+) Transcript_40601:1464-1928(+)
MSATAPRVAEVVLVAAVAAHASRPVPFLFPFLCLTVVVGVVVVVRAVPGVAGAGVIDALCFGEEVRPSPSALSLLLATVVPVRVVAVAVVGLVVVTVVVAHGVVVTVVAVVVAVVVVAAVDVAVVVASVGALAVVVVVSCEAGADKIAFSPSTP